MQKRSHKETGCKGRFRGLFALFITTRENKPEPVRATSLSSKANALMTYLSLDRMS